MKEKVNSCCCESEWSESGKEATMKRNINRSLIHGQCPRRRESKKEIKKKKKNKASETKQAEKKKRKRPKSESVPLNKSFSVPRPKPRPMRNLNDMCWELFMRIV